MFKVIVKTPKWGQLIISTKKQFNKKYLFFNKEKLVALSIVAKQMLLKYFIHKEKSHLIHHRSSHRELFFENIFS